MYVSKMSSLHLSNRTKPLKSQKSLTPPPFNYWLKRKFKGPGMQCILCIMTKPDEPMKFVFMYVRFMKAKIQEQIRVCMTDFGDQDFDIN